MISKKVKHIFFSSAILFSLSLSSVQAEEGYEIIDESIQDLNVVMGTGLGGAVLGLSTLSFVEKPSEHLKNVILGASLGIIIGVGIVAFGQANKSKERYFENASNSEFKTFDRYAWHQASHSSFNKSKDLSLFAHSFTF